MYKSRNNIKDIFGLIFHKDLDFTYILDIDGEICCIINRNKNEINQMQLNHAYNFKNLYFIKKDKKNYLLYDIKMKTSFKEVNCAANFKRFAIIRFIFLDDNTNEKNAKMKIRNQDI